MKIKIFGKPSEQAIQLLNSVDGLRSGKESEDLSKLELVVANYGSSLSELDKHEINTIFDEKPALFYLENTTVDSFITNSVLQVDSKACLLFRDSKGHHIFVLDKGKQPALLDPCDENMYYEEVTDDNGVKKIVAAHNPNVGISEEQIVKEAVKEDLVTPSFVLDWLTSRFPSSSTLNADEDIQPINGSLVRGSITTLQKNGTRIHNKVLTNNSLYASFDVELAAVVEPKRNKIIKINSVNTFVKAKLGKNNTTDRVWGSRFGKLILYPGSFYTYDSKEVSIPKGWRIIKLAPETKNSENSYTRTTGWSIGLEGGGEVGPDGPKGTVKLNLSYNESQSYTEAFNDFEVENHSDSSYCYWKYEYTKVKRDPSSIFSFWANDVENFPDLAKSTMYLKNEVVFETPKEENAKVRFNFFIGNELLHAHGTTFGGWSINHNYDLQGWDHFYINTDTVRFPE